MKYYEVKAKCGHVGRKYYLLKTFAVKANNGKDAAKIVRDFPRVKHHHKDAIRELREIDKERYYEILNNNHKDPYFFCHNVQDQKRYVENRIYQEESFIDAHEEKENLKRVFNGKELIRKPKHYIRNNYFIEGWAY